MPALVLVVFVSIYTNGSRNDGAANAAHCAAFVHGAGANVFGLTPLRSIVSVGPVKMEQWTDILAI